MHDRMLMSHDEEQMVETNDRVSPLILSGSVMSVRSMASGGKMLPVMAVCATVYLTAASACHWIAGLASFTPRG